MRALCLGLLLAASCGPSDSVVAKTPRLQPAAAPAPPPCVPADPRDAHLLVVSEIPPPPPPPRRPGGPRVIILEETCAISDSKLERWSMDGTRELLVPTGARRVQAVPGGYQYLDVGAPLTLVTNDGQPQRQKIVGPAWSALALLGGLAAQHRSPIHDGFIAYTRTCDEPGPVFTETLANQQALFRFDYLAEGLGTPADTCDRLRIALGDEGRTTVCITGYGSGEARAQLVVFEPGQPLLRSALPGRCGSLDPEHALALTGAVAANTEGSMLAGPDLPAPIPVGGAYRAAFTRDGRAAFVARGEEPAHIVRVALPSGAQTEIATVEWSDHLEVSLDGSLALSVRYPDEYRNEEGQATVFAVCGDAPPVQIALPVKVVEVALGDR